MTGYFVTGTDTNVGKTVLSALLVAALNATYWKPVQTGAIEGTDREAVRRWTGADEDRLSAERFRFDPPVSPHLAAREAGITITLDAFEFPAAPANRKWIVEGAGGVMVPLNDHELMRDLIARIGLPAIVAARTSLGTINHTLLTLSALREARIPIHGVALIGDENIENCRAIEHYGQIRVVGRIPMLKQIHRAALLEVYERHFDQEAFA
ncbi:MAG TPA: dethiobiotin synthase [Verrucomicrobiae bacterium]|jgi:dethiobiotin synthetase|nr:dethiobiotin synthase [Verrucomicrobiae bacterium]